MSAAAVARILNMDAAGTLKGLTFFCPGCQERHQVTTNGPNPWGWNGDLVRPTFTPSVLVTSGHFMPGRDGKNCWCIYSATHPDEPASFVCKRCHSFVTDGQIQFLGDCTHALAGKTVPLPPVDPAER
ncbi:MAG: hypothetical protein JWO51_124 [Rhodospirillales bacterium]|nr:hypothetical protein [Rhodospirillales bacterium]